MNNFSFNFYSNEEVVYKGFSDNTLKYADKCIKELSASGLNSYENICYLARDTDVFSLYYSIKRLGFLSKENDGTDTTFKKFIYYLYKDIGKFYAVVFPCYVDWYPYSNRVVVFKTKESFNSIKGNIHSNISISAYDNKGFKLDMLKIVNDFTSTKELRDRILSCSGDADRLLSVLGKDWGIYKEDFISIVMSKSLSGSPVYIEVFL